ncbi:hypothetical protein [Micromonospora sp. RTGN7]|uniref:hypothetical protein n=1 Tax=Micromonospora sp. RTGN7 TaxID=3016526 RepID=UPI0029FEF343|nr:hypothetical protein [Micromonospora sp. RTGN7]
MPASGTWTAVWCGGLRRAIPAVLQYTVELELLEFNPVDKLRVRSTRRKVSGEVDRRVVVNIRQARELLTGVSYVGRRGKNGRRGERLVAFYACLCFAALRPNEALGLRERNCHLPAPAGAC